MAAHRGRFPSRHYNCGVDDRLLPNKMMPSDWHFLQSEDKMLRDLFLFHSAYHSLEHPRWDYMLWLYSSVELVGVHLWHSFNDNRGMWLSDSWECVSHACKGLDLVFPFLLLNCVIFMPPSSIWPLQLGVVITTPHAQKVWWACPEAPTYTFCCTFYSISNALWLSAPVGSFVLRYSYTISEIICKLFVLKPNWGASLVDPTSSKCKIGCS